MKPLFALAWLLASPLALASESPHLWSVSLNGSQAYLRGLHDNHITGRQMSVGLGTGYKFNRFLLYGNLETMLGPFQPMHQAQLDMDFFGTAITLQSAYAPESFALTRDDARIVSILPTLGLSYIDQVGRSIGRNRRESTAQEDPTLIDNYSLRATTLLLIPSVGVAWQRTPREKGNTPELLKTRVEGFLFSLGVGYPVQSTYTAKYYTRGKSSEPTIERHHFVGYSIIAGLTSFLGT